MKTEPFLFLQLFFYLSHAVIQGTVTADLTISTNVIQSQNVTLKYSLQCEDIFQSQGKLLVVFPSQFTFTSSSINPVCINLDNGNARLDCQLNPQASLLVLKINSTSFQSSKTLQFTVSNLTNPQYALPTDPFIIYNYYTDPNNNQQYEPSNDQIIYNPAPGIMTQISLILDNPTVGATTNLQINLTLQHQIPANGQLMITFPQWWGSSVSYLQGGTTVCTSVQGLSSSPNCIFYTNSETLYVSMGNAISGGTSISFKINNILAPPSQSAVSGILIQSTTSNENQVIDKGRGSIKASNPASMTGVSLYSSTNYQVNTFSTVTLEIQNTNPVPGGSTLIIAIPSDLKVNKLLSLQGRGGTLPLSPVLSLSSGSNGFNLVTLVNFNQMQNTDPQTYHYLSLTQLCLPPTTKPTGSFQVQILDPKGLLIEQALIGLVLTPTPGPLTAVALSVSSQLIYQSQVTYSFRFTPFDSFNSSALIKVTFPDQIQVASTATVFGLPSSAKIQVIGGKQVIISGGTTGKAGQIAFNITGITNPSSIKITDSFMIELYYSDSEKIDQITQGLTFTGVPNNNLLLQVYLSSQETGGNSIMQVALKTPYAISKGSYIVIGIPNDFQIYDPSVSASNCLKITGFTNEIQCSLSLNTGISSNGIHSLVVRNGFDSRDFSGGSFSFNISQIRNPKNSKETGSFTASIYDILGNLQYIYQSTSVTFMLAPSPFQYALVTSSSPKNGQSTVYTFTLTLSVDTDVLSVIQIVPPPQVVFDSSKNISCSGLLNLATTQLKCVSINKGKLINVYVWGDRAGVGFIQNGTTISFQIGNFINPISLQESDSFSISTFITSQSNTMYYYINQQTSDLTIQNTAAGSLQIVNISLLNTQLGESTQIKLMFNTQNKPSGPVKLVITLPSNLVTQANIQATLNGINVTTTYQAVSRQLTINIPSASQTQSYNLLLYSGLQNPFIGPFTYDQFILDFQDYYGYSIDDIILNNNNTIISVQCTSNCATCQGILSNCTSCSQINNVSYFLSGKQCLKQCQPGWYGDGSENKCKQCSFPCTECLYGPDLCTKCNSNYSKPYANPTTLSCQKECPSGTYLDLNQSLCLPCKAPCETCIGRADKCLQCQFGFFFFQNTCSNVCPNKTVQTPSNQCLSCQSPCLTCSLSPDQCTTCLSGYLLLHNSICTKSCPTGYVSNLESLTCNPSGEQVFPFPFSILLTLLLLGLLLSRFLHKETLFLNSTLAFSDLLLKLNWIFLLPYSPGLTAPTFLIAWSLLATLVLNLFFWRPTPNFDPLYISYRKDFPCLSTLLLLVSRTLSSHMFKLTYSRLCGKKCFSGKFKAPPGIQMNVMQMIICQMPAIVAVAYSIGDGLGGQQGWYFQIDGVIMVSVVIILEMIGIVRGKEGQSKNNGEEQKQSFVQKEVLGVTTQIYNLGDLTSRTMITQYNKQSGPNELESNEELSARQSEVGSKIQVIDQLNDFQENEIEPDKLQEQLQTIGEQKAETTSTPNRSKNIRKLTQDFTQRIFGNLLKNFRTDDSSSQRQPLGQSISNQVNTQSRSRNILLRDSQTLDDGHLPQQLPLTASVIAPQTEQLHLKALLTQDLFNLRSENEYLLTEEDRLRSEINDIKRRLSEFQRITAIELLEQRSVRKDRQKKLVSIQDEAISDEDKKQAKQKKKKSRSKSKTPKQNKQKKKSPAKSKEKVLNGNWMQEQEENKERTGQSRNKQQQSGK